MALVGEAHVVVRAITDQVSKDIQKGFNGATPVARKAGESMGDSFTRGFNKNVNQNTFSRLTDALKTAVPGAEAARKAFQRLLGTGYALQTGLAALIPGIFSVIAAIGALGGAALGAIGSLAAFGNVLFALVATMTVVKLALGGVGKAVTALNKAQGGGGGGAAAAVAAAQARAAAVEAINSAEKTLALTIEQNRENLLDANNAVRDAQLALNAAFEAGREQIQQLGFDAEDAALAEKKAGLDLEKARIALAKAQDLPPNSRVRQEAELAFQEAELNLRKAKDRSADLNKEQDKLAKTGVRGTVVVISATNALAKAEANKAKTIRDALRSEIDAQENLAKAKENAANAGQGGGGGGGVDPLAGLNDAQKQFARFIAGLKPKFDELKAIAANSFLPPLQKAIDTLMTAAFPVVATGIGIVGKALGNVVVDLANTITSGQNLAKLGSLFASTGPLLTSMGKALGSLYGSILSILVAAAPVAQRFFDFLVDKLGQFDDYLNSVAGNAALNNFFKLAADAAAQFGRIFGNIFAAVGGIIEANLGPGSGGQFLLDWLEGATQGWDDLNSTIEGKNSLKDFFLDTSKNAVSVLGAFGVLGDILFKLAANPAIGKTFDILKTGGPAFEAIATAALNAGPNLANLVVKITEFVAKLTDTGAIQIFFDTLSGIIDFISGLFDSELGNAILTIHGRIIAFTVAFALVGQVAGFALKIIVGGLINLISPIGRVIAFIGTLTGSFVGATLSAEGFTSGLIFMTYSTNPLTRALGFAGLAVQKFGLMLKGALLGPIGIIIGVIALLVGSFIYLYNTSSTFKTQMDAIFAQLSAVFADAFQQIMAAVMPLIPVLTGAFQTIITALVPVLTMLAQAFGQIITALAPLIPLLLGALIPAFVGILTAIIPIITTVIEALVPVITTLISAILPLITTIINLLLPVFTKIIEAIMPVVTTIIGALVPVIETLLAAFLPLISTLIDAFLPIIEAVLDALTPILPVIIDLIKQGLDILIPIIQFLADVFAALVPILVEVVKFIINVLVGAIQGIVTVVTNVIKFLPKIGEAFSTVWNGILSFFKGVANGIITAFESMVNFIITGINNAIGVVNTLASALKEVSGGAINISIPKVPKISLPRLAKGGTVFPSTGGSIVNVAEAGRPERIEPLDANGLSKRDKAMIDFLSGGGAGGTTINVYALPGQDVNEIAAEVDRRISFRMRKGGTE